MTGAQEHISKAIYELEAERGIEEAFPVTLQLVQVFQQLTEEERDQSRKIVSISDRRCWWNDRLQH